MKVRSRAMRATILIVGDYPGLSTTRAELLREWQTVTTGTSGASEVLRARARDLLLFCQTVPETTVRELAAQAIELNPRLKVLTISEVGQIRQLGSSALVAELNNPSCLRRAVAALLQSNEQQTGRSL
jgi:DNA-binding NtrC family response regulator